MFCSVASTSSDSVAIYIYLVSRSISTASFAQATPALSLYHSEKAFRKGTMPAAASQVIASNSNRMSKTYSIIKKMKKHSKTRSNRVVILLVSVSRSPFLPPRSATLQMDFASPTPSRARGRSSSSAKPVRRHPARVDGEGADPLLLPLRRRARGPPGLAALAAEP